jgi:hypothetical protein
MRLHQRAQYLLDSSEPVNRLERCLHDGLPENATQGYRVDEMLTRVTPFYRFNTLSQIPVYTGFREKIIW